jgi:glucose/arabinose dehydrogenase
VGTSGATREASHTRTPRARDGGLAPRFAALLLGLAALGAAPARGELLEVLTADVAGPIYLTHAGDERLFLVEREGRIRVFAAGQIRATPFLDLHAKVDAQGEGGLLSMAFDPGYAANGAFYVSYTTDDPTTGFTSVVSRFHVSADPDVAETDEAVLLQLPQPYPNHNGGQIAFGPDGKLYVGFGDGGDRDDPGCRAQQGDTWFGKILRLDADPTGSAPPHYAIPPDNPFAAPGDGVLDEIWDTGLRNPWRFSFDRATGDLWIGDVGQDAVEEVDREAFGSAGGFDYGWKVMEGSLCSNPDAAMCPASVPGCDDPAYTPPLDEYLHQGGNRSITGGYVYRGSRAPGFAGAYVFGDFGSGRIFALHEGPPGVWQRSTLLESGPQWSSFGEGADGELYALDLAGGRVFRLDLASALGGEARACIRELNRGFAGVTRARARQLRRCLAKNAAGRLAAGAEACAAAEDSRVERAAAKTSAAEARYCAVPPPFGASDASTVNEAAMGAERALLHDVFGADLDAALLAKAVDRSGARCQRAAAAELRRCHARRVKAFVRCKKRLLRGGSVDGPAALEACLDAEPEPRCSAAGRLAARVLPRRCAAKGVDLAAAFPGCASADAAGVAACAERAGRCRVCAALSAADALGADCDGYDDGLANASCP